MNRIQGVWMAIAVSAALLLPWLGLTHFNTKGEPREATVAQAMLAQGDYVLPLTYGEDLPYKPPMLAWAICGAATLNGGEVTEYASRLPSALAAIILTAMTFMWLTRRRRGAGGVPPATALTASLLMLTTFEVLRAATVCRVDMLLTMFMVGSIYLLDDEGVKSHKPWRYIGAILMMSGAVMTKGPIGAFLPCLVAGIYRLWVGRPLLKTLGIMIGVGLASLLLPALWYWAAWDRGGEAFQALVMEENVGRLTGTMSYESHVNPWWYNFVSLLGGMAPYTLVALLCGVAYVEARTPSRSMARHPATPREISQLAWVAALVVLIFYCIPASKRSVYLLPMYPFMAWGIVSWCRALHRRWPVTLFAWILYIVAIAVPLFLVVITQMDVLRGMPAINLSIAGWMLVTLPALLAMALMIHHSRATLGGAVTVVVTLYIAFLGALQPAVLNARSNMTQARVLEALCPDGNV